MPDDRDMRWFVSGQVLVDETDEPMPGVMVRAWDDDLVDDDWLGECLTGPDGRFAISFKSREFDDHGTEDMPDIYLRVHVPSNDHVLLTTEDNIRYDAGRMERYELRVSHWSINLSDGPEFLRFRPQVHGVAVDTRRTPLVGLAIQVVDTEDGQVLFSGTTEAEGRYACWFGKHTGPREVRLRLLAADGSRVHESSPLAYDGVVPIPHRIQLEG